MTTYQIEIRETLVRIVLTVADSSEEALRKIKSRYDAEDIVLDFRDYVDTEIALLNHD